MNIRTLLASAAALAVVAVPTVATAQVTVRHYPHRTVVVRHHPVVHHRRHYVPHRTVIVRHHPLRHTTTRKVIIHH